MSDENHKTEVRNDFLDFVIVVSLPKRFYLPKSGYCCLWFSTPCNSHACVHACHACSHACSMHFVLDDWLWLWKILEIIFTPPTLRYHLRLQLYERICQLRGILCCANPQVLQQQSGGLKTNGACWWCVWRLGGEYLANPYSSLDKTLTVRPILGSSASLRIGDMGSDGEQRKENWYL